MWHYLNMRKTYILAIFFFLNSCSVAPTVDSNWINSNCSKIYYNPSSCETYSNCSCNQSTKKNTCIFESGDKYVGYLKGDEFHGEGDYFWDSGAYFKGVWKNDVKWCGIERNGNTYFLYKDGRSTQGEAGVDWGIVAGAILIGAAAYAIADSGSSSGGDSYNSSSTNSYCTYSHNYKEYTIENPNYSWGGSCPFYHTYEEPEMCSVYRYHSRECDVGKACGDTCISEYKTCHVGKGSACNKNYRSYP